MSETSWEERREFEERLYRGQAISAHDMQRLLDDADAGEKAEATLAALGNALRSQLGIAIVDSTTDDDDGQTRIELVRVEEEESSEGDL